MSSSITMAYKCILFNRRKILKVLLLVALCVCVMIVLSYKAQQLNVTHMQQHMLDRQQDTLVAAHRYNPVPPVIKDKHSVNIAEVEDEEEYDYIIVGGGVAGCVVARRLAEDADVSVLLLEAGVDDTGNAALAVPRLAMSVIKMAELNWGFETEPQEYGNHRKVLLTQGKVLGGSGSINAMGVTRGSRYDYDRWAEMGNIGWGYDDVLPYFKKSEKMLTSKLMDRDYRGSDGLYKVRQAHQFMSSDHYVRGIKELGINITKDYNAEQGLGFGYIQMNVDEHGYRSSTSQGYLRPVREAWNNIKVLTQATVTKVDIKDLTAQGVYFYHDDQQKYVKARREVILSAGSLNSPKLLMLSGVGPEQHLKDMEIPVVYNNPAVGSDLKDHPAIGLHFITHTKPEKVFSFASLLEYIFGRAGSWTTMGMQLIGFHKTQQQPAEDQFPYTEIILAQHVPHIPAATIQDIQNIHDPVAMHKAIEKINVLEPPQLTLAMAVVLLHPRMSGTVRLRSNHSDDKPIITLNYGQHEDDIKDMIEAIRLIQKLAATEAVKELKELKLAVTPCDGVFDSDEFWKCYIQRNEVSLYHYTSTCRMSPDNSGVVDLQLRVNGIRGLRVVDASVMPDVVSGHTMAATIMVAEKASDFIKSDYTQSPLN